MDADNLVHMANRIGEFFAASPDRDEAEGEMALHFLHFWEPRMRRQILQLVDSAAGEGLHPFVAEALRRHRDELMPVD
jgi:formate dehydrogenase subunit delta